MSDLKNLATERAVLSALCQYGEDARSECDFIEVDHFSNDSNQLWFKCIERVLEKGKVEFSSLLSAASEMGYSKFLEKEDEVTYLRSLFNFPIAKENVSFYASKLVKLRFAKDSLLTLKLIETALLKTTGDEDINSLINVVENPITELTNKIYSGENGTILIGSDIEDYVDYLADNPVDHLGIPTGYPEYDNLIGGGLRRKCFDLIGARTKAGKSVLADNIAINVCSLGIPVLMIDTEMSNTDHKNRMLANLSRVEINNIAKGKFGQDLVSREKVKKAAKDIFKMPYHYISVAGQSIDTIINIMKKFVKQVGVDENGVRKDCLIIYDYFKLMDSGDLNGNMAEFQLLGFQASKIHNFCVQYDVPCLSFIQLNRDGINKESSDVISQSDRIGWLCTSFSIFKAKSDEEFAEDGPQNGNRKMVVVLTRHGEGSQFGDYVNYAMNGKIASIIELGTRDQCKNKRDNDKGFDDTE